MKFDFVSVKSPQDLVLNELDSALSYRSFICVRSKTKDIIYTYTHKAHKKTLLKLTQDKENNLHLWIRFSAAESYSAYFTEKLIETLEEDKYRYVGCYPNCCECDVKKGYIITSPKGSFFRCYKELIHIGKLDELPLEEVLTLIDIQNAFEKQSVEKTLRKL